MNELWLARHGETEWTLSRQHTSSTDLQLTPHGEEEARALGGALAGHDFALALSSPAQRARRTAELAGFGGHLEIVEDLREWDYGEYEGRTTADIKKDRPDWDLWRDGCPGGEQTADVAKRADHVLKIVGGTDGPVAAFGHGHMSRVLGARFLGLDGEGGRMLMLSTATLSVLGYEHGNAAVSRWNDDCHLRGLK